MSRSCLVTSLSALMLEVLCGTATHAQESQHFWAGDWSLTLGGAGSLSQRFEGDSGSTPTFTPIISLGRRGGETRFASRNDSASFALVDTQPFRAGVAGKLLFGRDGETASALEGLEPVRWGGEIGAFVEIYPLDWLRVRSELRRGIRSHNGVVADFSADAFTDLSPTIQISSGPRLSMASQGYFDSYYGVSAPESLASGLAPYTPDGGLKSIGLGGALSWKATDKITTSLFAEYARLMGPAAASSLVKERGSRNQFMAGISADYRFDFTFD